MEAKTHTTLAELRIGDSFVYENGYPKRTEIWRVMQLPDSRNRVAVNRINADTRKPILRHDVIKKGSVRVVFIRHTVPVEGQECLLDDLEPGDMCSRPDPDDNATYVVIRHGSLYTDLRRADGLAPIKASRGARVIFISH